MLIMKRTIVFIIATIFTLGLFAQSNTTVTTTIQGDGYSYIKETKKSRLVRLYNKENEYANVPLVYKDTGSSPDYDLQESRVEDDDWTSWRSENIVNSVLRRNHKQLVLGHKLGIGIYVDSATGKVIGVDFRFLETSPLAEVPITVFREIELRMKDEIHFTLTDTGRQYNYLYFGWIQVIE
jgi:hypothetical protein